MKTRDLVFPFFLFASFLIASSTMFAFVDKPSYLIPLFVFFSCTIFWLYIKSSILFEEKIKTNNKNEPLKKEDKTDLSNSIEYILEAIPSAIIIIDKTGKITFTNTGSEILMPGLLKVGNHISTIFRSPVFLEAVDRAIAIRKNIKITFDSPMPLFQHIRVHFVQMPKDSFSASEGHILLKFSDQSKNIMIEQMRSDFISNASHELRTPLASIIGFIETIQGHAKNDKANRELFLSMMYDQAVRMQRLVDDLLSLSKLELQENSPPSSNCDVFVVIDKIVKSFLPLAKKYKVKLTNNLPLNLSNTVGDEVQMQQLFSNLIENALKYSGESSNVKIELVKKQKNRNSESNMMGIQIIDNGKGIPTEHIYRLTERFYRVNADLSRERQGTGLGLSIVKHILNRHKGELEIESVPQKGSIFTTWLPVSKTDFKQIKRDKAA